MAGEVLLFLSSFAFYLFGSSPALDGGDAGEFITSSFTLGIPHAPGYPLYQLLGKVLHVLMPFSTPAYRCHVLSALICSSLLILFWKLLMRLFGEDKKWPLLAAVIFLGTRPLFIEQARVAEVFGLNGLFAVAILICLLRQQKTLAWFLFGLGMGNHHTLIVLAPLFVIPARFWPGSRFFLENTWAPARRHAGATMGFFLLGLSVYLYLPIRAHSNPPVNFGDPETFWRFISVILRREFGALSLHPAAVPFRDMPLVIGQTQQFLGRVWHQTGLGGLVLIAAGIFIGLRRPDRRWMVLVAGIGWLGLGWGFEIYSNLSPMSDIGQWRLERFYFLPLISSTVLAAIALESLSLPFLFVGFFCMAQALWGFWNSANFRWNLAFRDFATSALRCAPFNSLVVIDRVLFDEPTSSMLVLTETEKKRDDLGFLYRPGTLFKPVYGEDFLDLTWDERLQRQREVEGLLLTPGKFPVRALAFERANTPFKTPRLHGLLYAEGTPLQRSEGFFIQRTAASDYPSRLISVHIPYFMGKAALERNNKAAAKKWFELAMEKSGGMAWLWCNIGGLYAQSQVTEESCRLFEEAAVMDPYFYEAQYGLGYAYLVRNQPDKAIQPLRTVTRLAPERSEGFYMLGVAYTNAGENQKAVQPFKRYLVLDPHGAMADSIRKQLALIKA